MKLPLVRRLVALVAFVILLLTPGVRAGAQEDAGAVSIRLVDAPTERRDDPRARIYIVDHLQPGATIERRIEIANSTPNDLTISLYAAAASLEDDTFRFGAGRATNELTSWTRITPEQVRVPAGGRETATVRIVVPADAVDGERYGVIWAELPSSGGTAAVVNRVGIRMYLSIGEGSEPETDFRIDTLTASRDGDGRPVVRTTITNTGGRAIDVGGTLRLEDGPGSLSAGPFDVEVGTTLAPGDRAPALVRLDPDLPDGPWKATITVTAGELEKEAAATITFPSEAGSSADPVDATPTEGQRKVLIPVAAVLIALLLLGLGAHRLRRSGIGGLADAVKVAKG